MKKIYDKLLVFATIVSVLNLLLVLQIWHRLPAQIPGSFSPDGTSHAMHSRDMLFLSPIISVVVVLIAAFVCRGLAKKHVDYVIRILALSLCLILFCSTCVAITFGTQPLFMWAEPTILLLALIAIVVHYRHDKKEAQKS